MLLACSFEQLAAYCSSYSTSFSVTNIEYKSHQGMATLSSQHSSRYSGFLQSGLWIFQCTVWHSLLQYATVLHRPHF